MKVTCREPIRYDRNFRKGKNDFFGEDSPLSAREQKEFLQKYLESGKKAYGQNFLSEKSVERSEAADLAETLRNPGRKDDVYSAYTKPFRSGYENWILYTDRTKIESGKICFYEDYKWPVPCAKLLFSNAVREFAFEVKIPKEYFSEQKEGALSTSTGRCVEFRKGCKGVANLCFLPYGALIYKDGTREEYHYELHELFRYPFGEWFCVKVGFEQSRVLVFVNGRQYSFPNGGEDPDNLFLSGGMQPVNGWEFRPISCTLKNGTQPDLFEKRKEIDCGEEYIGEVKLPFALGTEKNRDKILILRRKFHAAAKRVYTLEIDSLDPGGYVAVNGKTVIRKDDFSPFRIDITDYVTSGENELELGIFPRAPEVLYSWHKHNDCYNAWLCQGVNVRESGIFIRDNCRIVTHKTGEKVDFSVTWDVSAREVFSYRIFLAKIFPQKDGEILLKEGTVRERIDERFLVPLDVWSPETPNLYRVRIELLRNGETIYTEEAETGFRTIEQREGGIFLNGRKIRLKGALNMQFLPPYEEIPVNHLCPDDVQICEQLLTLKKMNGNCFRMHQLGYGTSDKRIAEYADRLGIMLIWTTRLIDSVENLRWSKEWHAASSYVLHMQHVINHPSVIMWEGSNEFHASSLAEIDRIYDSFVRYAGGADPTRLLCPVSHLYYGGGIYDYGCKYYNNAGTSDELGNPVDSSFGWKSERVVRSAHTYSLLLGYGAPWKDMREQNWAFQNELLNAEEKAYLVSEYAVIGRQNPETEEAKKFINKNSYELSDEKASLGFCFSDEEWELSQAYQALCAAVATRQLFSRGADGMLWCCLWGGANNASYLKPIVDFYGYKKFAYYVLKDCFKETVVMNVAPDVLFYPGYEILPFVCGTEQGKRYGLTVRIEDENGRTVDVKNYGEFVARGESERGFAAWQPNIESDGYYTVCYELEEKER